MSHWFEGLADHMGPAYLRYSFTKGTVREVDALVERLGLAPGIRILDVGCGPGRHANELGRRGYEVHGVDISETFLAVARADAPPGLAGGPAAGDRLDPDLDILDGMARALKPGGTLVFTAFNAYLQVANLLEGNDFDAIRGVHRERTEIRDADGDVVETDLWTTCFTPRELRLMCERAGLEVRSIDAVEPGRWAPAPPDVDSPEFLVIATASLGRLSS